MRYIVFWLSLFVISLYSITGNAQTFEKKRNIYRSYKISDGMKVDVSNKYGNIEIKHWEKDSVRFEIKMVGSAKTKDKLAKLMSLISFEFSNTSNTIKATTTVGSSSNDLMSELQNLSDAIFTIGSQAKINYMVYLPAANPLKIENSFGDVYLGNMTQAFQIDLAHGDLRAGYLKSTSKITQRFGKASIKFLKDAELDMSFAELDLNKAEKVKLVSKSTKYNIKEIDLLIIESRKDEFNIDIAKTIEGNSTFSKFKIENFTTKIDLVTKLGSINLDEVSKYFSGIYIKSEYTDMTFTFESDASYSFYLTHSELELRLPSDITNVTEEVINKENKQKLTKGTIGKSTSPKSKVKIEAVKGELKIFHN